MGALNPFAEDSTLRYAYAWEKLAGRTGRHLEVGCATGPFVGPLADTTDLDCYGVDPHPGYLAELRHRWPAVTAARIGIDEVLPFGDAAFDSASLLDVLEHVPAERHLLAEIHRVLAPGALLVVTVPRRHVFSFLDPDNAKFRWPRFHRFVYTARFGADVYRERFVDLSNGLRGDMSVGRDEHTNYREEELVDLLASEGFRCVDRSGANLFWRWFHVPALLAGPRLRRVLERAILADGRLFRRANLFLTLERDAP